MLFGIASEKKYVWKANLDEQGRITHFLLCLPGGIKLALDYPTVNNFDFRQLILIALTRRTSLRCLYYCNLEPSSLQKVHSYMRLTTILNEFKGCYLLGSSNCIYSPVC
jgi:hypothetical protein